ncbi:hypothetical protein [Sabulibacter ruber]|uniref:hypothetical protein n=1 Tax=Sabulibacter ruber TaxID=2811901 RepID=UPI001A965981|nr:hypothetical protein [Sabulibacter ruber]
MKKSLLFIYSILVFSLSGCSWLSSFYIINNTQDKIIITFSLMPTQRSDYDFAIKDTIEFYKLKKDWKAEDSKLTKDSSGGTYLKENRDGLEYYKMIINPNSAASSGSNLPNFTFQEKSYRREIFSNIIEMQIIRQDTKDTVWLKPSFLADFSKQLGKFDISLVLE